MRYSDLTSKNRTLVNWIKLAAAGTLVAALAACGGGGDSAPAAPAGGAAAPAAPAAAVPTGTAPVTFSATTGAALTSPVVTVGSVTIASPPVVSFAISDGATTNNPVLGVTAATTGVRFMLAKLVPGTNGSPSKWVSYGVLNSAGTGAQRPSYEVNGTLVDNGNGTYSYTFANDITALKDKIAAMTFTAPESAADLGDLTYDPTLTHRLVIQFSGNSMPNPVNAVYDFIPATGKAVAATDTQREVVAIDSCNQCHEKLTIHGSRNQTQYCATCHTDQRKFGRANVASTSLAFPALVELAKVDATTGITSYYYSKNTTTTSSSYHPTGIDPTYVGDGEVMGDFTTMVHKIHQGYSLLKQNYNYANLAFNNLGYSILSDGQKMCAKCHDSTKAAQADNYAAVPSRLACGACHDGINFATGTGTALNGATTGHAKVNLAQTNDAGCSICHTAADIKVFHYADNVSKHNPTVATGLATFAYHISSATVDANNDVVVTFKITKDGTALTTLPPTGFTTTNLAFLLAWAVPQDGITTPVDFNNTTRAKGEAISLTISSVIAGTNGSTLAGPDASGHFTATLKGTAGTHKFPVGANMRTVALNGYYTQTAGTGGIAANTARHAISVVKTVTGDTERRQVIEPAKCSNCHEWLELHGGNRVLAPETEGAVNVCVMCHVPAKATSGRGLSDAVVNTYASTGPKFSASDLKKLAEWGLSTTFPVSGNWALGLPVAPNNFKDMIHGIHSGRDRVNPFQDARDRTSGGGTGGAITLLDFRRMNFPGKINNCETCHKSGTYASVPAGALASTLESVNTAVGGNTTTALALAALSQPNTTDKVTSPFAAACVSCHDSVSARSHFPRGGVVNEVRSTFAANIAAGVGEGCVTCHGVGKFSDVTVKHK